MRDHQVPGNIYSHVLSVLHPEIPIRIHFHECILSLLFSFFEHAFSNNNPDLHFTHNINNELLRDDNSVNKMSPAFLV